MVEVGLHRVQIAIIDTNEGGTDVQHAVEVFLRVQFHQRRHAQIEDLAVEAPQVAVVEALGDQEHRIGPVSPRLEHLIAIDDKLLPQHRQRHSHAGRLEIDEAAAKPDGIREHGERRGPGGRIAADDLLDYGVRTKFAGGRTLSLEFGDESDRPGSSNRREEVADRRRYCQSALDGRRRHPFACDFDLTVLSGHDRFEQGRHGDNGFRQ